MNPPSFLTIEPLNISIAILAKDNKLNTPLPVIHVLASGPSIKQINLKSISKQPCIMVNGAICLNEKHDFTQLLGLVVTDARFIKHNYKDLKEHFNQGQFYLTQAVLNALIHTDADFVIKHHKKMVLIFDALKPIDFTNINPLNKPSLYNKITKKLNKSHNKKHLLNSLQNNPNFIFNNEVAHTIGCSLDMTQGFIEAGTVAYVASQLAYFLRSKQIVLHGMDLKNANEPRFYENQNNSAPSMLSKAVENRIIPSFELLAESLNKQNVVMINGSPVSKDLFKHIVYKSFIK